MRVYIEDIIRNSVVLTSAKNVVIESDDGYKTKILISLKNHHLDGVSCLRAPTKDLFACHIAIGTDVLCTGATIYKNRWDETPNSVITIDVLLNEYMPTLLTTHMGFDNMWDRGLIMSNIASALSQITFEPIFNINGYYKTERCIYTKRDMIRYKKLTHRFINQKKSLSLQNEI